MDRLTNWRARRSGGRITIHATDDTGQPVKVPNIDLIELRTAPPIHKGKIIAKDKDGDEFELAV